MEKTPLIVLSFSNDKDNYLDMLVRERKSIFRSLQNYHDKGYIQVHQEMNTSIEDLFGVFTRYSNQVQIFHYGGHANGNNLQLENTGNVQMASANGLADLLGQQTELKLVFLNGCATEGQVELLLKSGIKAVIATSVPINDSMAVEFAEQFYQSLNNQANIEQSYATARAFVLTKYGQKKQINQFRDIGFKKAETQKDEMPWGLYVKQENIDVLEWKLPQLGAPSIVVDSKGLSYKNAGAIHKKLMEILVKGLPVFDEDVNFMLEKYKKNPDAENKNNVNLFIVNSFPAPIGLQIRKLFSNKEVNADRLQQLLDTYKGTIELICYIMLSQLWDEKVKNPNIKISEEEQVVFNSFFSLNQTSYKSYNYYQLLRAIHSIFKANYLQPYIIELKDFMLEEDELQQSVKYMEYLKTIEINRIPPVELERLCIEAELNLCIVLNKFLFIVRYKFVLVKNIELIKERHQSAKYKHTTLLLKQVEGKGSHETSQKLYDDFSDNKSVIISRSINTLTEFLNLSPFIIDENALLGETNSKLYYYCYSDDDKGDNVYRFLDGDETLHVNENHFPEMKRWMDCFKKDLLGVAKATEGITIEAASESDALIDGLL